MDLISGLRYAAAEKATGPLHAEVVAAFSLEKRTAVVTGAASGIGRGIAVAYGMAGAKVVLADTDAEGLGETAAGIEDAVVVPTDVTDKAAVDDLARAAVRASGRIDAWVNVAGIIRNAAIVDLTEDELDAVIAVNLKGTLWGTAAAARVMGAAGKGAIVNIASGGGETPVPTLAAYGMTKAAVIQLTRIAAAELGPAGIRVNAVAPGFVETPMTSRHWTGEDGSTDEEARSTLLERYAGVAPLRTVGTPTDMAWAALYLAADASRFVTGQVLRPNGGVQMP